MNNLKLIGIPIIVALSTQTLKFFISWLRTKQFDWSTFGRYGGMPSGHTALVVSLATVTALSEGINSAAFAISAIFGLLVIRDAVSFRQSLSRYGQVLQVLISEHSNIDAKNFPERIEERLGHTPLQAAVGGLIGLVLSASLFFLLS